MTKKTFNTIPEALADAYTINQLREAIRIKDDSQVTTKKPDTPLAPTHPGVGSGYPSTGSPFYDAGCSSPSLPEPRSDMQNVDPFDLAAKPITGAYDEELHGWMYEEKNKTKG
jgi:hypothetical protein